MEYYIAFIFLHVPVLYTSVLKNVFYARYDMMLYKARDENPRIILAGPPSTGNLVIGLALCHCGMRTYE